MESTFQRGSIHKVALMLPLWYLHFICLHVVNELQRMSCTKAKNSKSLILNVSLYNFGKYICEWLITEDEIRPTDSDGEECDIYVTMTARFWYSFFTVLQSSANYRKMVLHHCHKYVKKNDMFGLVNINKISKDIMDHSWNCRVQRLVYERLTLDTVMSYLSTLGGAFSSLGDTIPECAVKAGQISRKQFDVALRLGEEPLVARCRLYLALSLIQQSRLKIAKEIILRQYVVANTFHDTKLKSMCKGLWARLQYTVKMSKLEKAKDNF